LGKIRKLILTLNYDGQLLYEMSLSLRFMQKPRKYFSNPYLFMLQVCWAYAGNLRKKYLLVYAAFVVSNLAIALVPIIYGAFINDIQQNGSDVLKRAWIYASLYVGIKLCQWAFHGPARVAERNLAFHMSANFLDEYYHKTLQLPVKWHQDHHSGEIINRIRKAHESIRSFFERGFECVYSLARFSFSFIAMIYFSPLFGLVAAGMGVIVITCILRFDKPYIRTLGEVNEKEHVVYSALFDSLSNVITVITLRLQQRMQKTLMGRLFAVLPPFKRNVNINEWKWFVVDIFVALIYAVILIGYVWQNWVPGEIFLLGGLVTLMGYVEQFTSVFHNVAFLYTDVVKDATNVRTAFVIQESYHQHHLPGSEAELPASWNTISISNLSFSHRGHEDFIPGSGSGEYRVAGLHNINMELVRGKKIALIGESGSGKSTLLAILRGLYPPDEGTTVLVDGVRHEEDIDVITSHVTLFPQEPEIFENTIEYNITLGLQHEDQEISDICDTAHFSEVLQKLPAGLQTNIAEKGVNLSGGQKQRLALARGIFAAKESDIILLDEPTSSVDPKTELRIYQKLFSEFSDKVIVSSLHRLHLLRHFDYIYVLQNGNIAAEGSLADLLAGSSIFRELWKHQETA
jgi:ATP-binding cassette subfamily B protein